MICPSFVECRSPLVTADIGSTLLPPAEARYSPEGPNTQNVLAVFWTHTKTPIFKRPYKPNSLKSKQPTTRQARPVASGIDFWDQKPQTQLWAVFILPLRLATLHARCSAWDWFKSGPARHGGNQTNIRLYRLDLQSINKNGPYTHGFLNYPLPPLYYPP